MCYSRATNHFEGGEEETMVAACARAIPSPTSMRLSPLYHAVEWPIGLYTVEVPMAYAVDFAELKARLSIEQVAEMLGLDAKQQNGQLRCRCPVHDGGSRALVITPAKESFYCFAPECKTGGDLIALYAHVKQLPVKEAAGELARLAGVGLEPLAYLETKHPAVEALGITHEQAAHIGIGYAARGTLIGRVAIPIRDQEGKLICYAGYAEHLKPRLKFGKLRL